MHSATAGQWQEDAAQVSGVRAFLAGMEFTRDPIRAVERYHRRFGSAIAFAYGAPGRPARIRSILLLGPTYNREILTNTDSLRPSGLWSVPGPRGSVQRAMKFSYVTASGAEHTELARTLGPHLSRPRVDSHFEAIRDITVRGVAGWPVGERVDLYSLARQVGQHAAFTLLFGESDLERVCTFGKQLADYHRANWQFRSYLRLRIPGMPYEDVLSRAERLRDFVSKWVDERRGCPASQDLRAAFVAHRNGKGEPLTAEQLAAHLNFLGWAAYETMSSTLSWTVFLLALHPNVHGDLADELAAAPPVATISQERLAALPLLDAVVKEALRLVPPTPMLVWRTIRDWETGSLRLTRGTRIALSPHVTHRIPEIYPEPRRFRPDRWSRIKPTQYEYLPFGAGPRRCPGYGFANEFLKVALAAFVPRFRLDASPGVRIDRVYWGITMPKPGIPVRLLPQDRSFRPMRATGDIRELVDVDDVS